MVTRLFGFSVLMALSRRPATRSSEASTGDLNPAKVSEGGERLELRRAQYMLTIVSGQLAQVHVITDRYADTLEVDKFPLVRLVRADENSYCVEFQKTQTYVLRGPGGAVAQGTC